jgi:hypothetical protein
MFERAWYRILVVGGLALGALVPAAKAAPQIQQPTLSVDDVSVAEGESGSTLAVFTVTLSPLSLKSVEVDFATADGSASTEVDYVPARGTLTFAEGQTTKKVAVDVLGDTSEETDETFFLELSNAKGAFIADGKGQATIRDDDTVRPNDPPRLEGVNDRSVRAGDTAAIDMLCTDSDGTTLSIQNTSAGPNSSFTQTPGNPASGRYRQNTTGQEGLAFTVTFVCTDDGNPPASDTKSARITVLGVATLTVACTVEGRFPCFAVGSVTSSPSGIDCGYDCSEDYPNGTVVILTAVPGNRLYAFRGWSGACSAFGTSPTCTLTMDVRKTAGAEFGVDPCRPIVCEPEPPDRSRLTVACTVQGISPCYIVDTVGKVTSSPSGIDCGNDCSEDFPNGTVVTLTAVPGHRLFAFRGWSGACSAFGTSPTCTLTMDVSKTVGADFGVDPCTYMVCG